MNFYPGTGVQPPLVAKDKTGYYAPNAGYPQTFPVGGIGQSSIPQPSRVIPSQSLQPNYNQTSAMYGIPVPYSGANSYPALAAAAYSPPLSTSMPGPTSAGYAGLGHPSTTVPSSYGHMSSASSLQFQPTLSYSQPTYIGGPAMPNPEQRGYNPQMSLPNSMYPASSPYPGYPGTQMPSTQQSYSNIGYSPNMQPRGPTPYTGPVGFVPSYPY